MIWHVINQVGSEDKFAPSLQTGDPRLVVALDNPASPYQVGNNVLDTIYKNGLELEDVVIDLLHLSMAVYAADLRIERRLSDNQWEREIILYMPVSEPARWKVVLPTVTQMLSFLTGDKWTIVLRQREPYNKPTLKASMGTLPNIVALFSGGLDSFVGAVDLLEESESRVALVGQYGKGSTNPSQKNSYQVIAARYPGRTLRLGFFVQPSTLDGQVAEDTMRSRSFLFLALGSAVASSCGAGTPLRVSENGLISLNVPLTYSRMGSLSTRTTHPYVIALFREILAALEIVVPVELPYRFSTKGEMLKDTKNPDVLREGLPYTLSCSRPDAGRFQKRSPGTHCGYCVPCLIRLSSMKAAGFRTKGAAFFDVVSEDADPSETKGRDRRAFAIALQRVRTLRQLQLVAEVLHTGPLPPEDIRDYVEVYKRGMEEVGEFLQRRRKR